MTQWPVVVADIVFVLIVVAFFYGVSQTQRREHVEMEKQAALYGLKIETFAEHRSHILRRVGRRMSSIAVVLAFVVGGLSADWSLYQRPLGGLTLIDLFWAAVIPLAVLLVGSWVLRMAARWWSDPPTESELFMAALKANEIKPI